MPFLSIFKLDVQFLLGYMIFSSGVLLAFMGGLMWYTGMTTLYS